MKVYAVKMIADEKINVVKTKGDPLDFDIFYHYETQGVGFETDPEDPFHEVKIMDAVLVGELPKDVDGNYIYPERAWRNCWRDNGGTVEVDLPLARGDKMAGIRAKRDKLLKKSDEHYTEELSKGSSMTNIDADKVVFRDLAAAAQIVVDAETDASNLTSYDAFSGLSLNYDYSEVL